ncbi:MAG: ATP-binding cassette domain-containing protein, partial [Planctomycetes bacterium]|nr:ATP-binding cassette domain-containing protein [Planctomycetota bacterium]
VLAFIIVLVGITAVTFFYFLHKKEQDKLLENATQKDTELFECLSHILDGFKEIRLNKRKNDDLFNHYQGIADSTEEVKVKTGLGFVNVILLAQIFFFSVVAIILFLLPTLISTYSGVVLKTVMAFVFLVGPLEFVVSSISIISRANVGIGNLYHLEDLLNKANDHEASGKSEDRLGFSREINLEKITFSYTDTKGNALFTLGPINLSIKQGEVLFVVGGNGSGKSTLLKLLTGLYYPMHGSILLDDKKISKPNFPAYREFFSAVFADFHLFDRFYGLGEVKVEKVNNLIKTMGLDTKTQYIDGKFSDINLSTGQRKRLALIVAFLDDKPVYILDEVTADQ